MKKDELTKNLLNIFKLEESAIDLYMQHLSPIVNRSTLDEDSLKKIKEIMQVMEKLSHHHKNTCQNLLSRIEMDERNDY